MATVLDPSTVMPLSSGREARSWLREWPRLVGPVTALLMLGWIVSHFMGGGLNEIEHALPVSPRFWLLLVLFLAIEPVFDFAIYRKLWALPFSGLLVLFRKTATNELLLGYLGEVQFYAWARKHAGLAGSPFGAIKDVAVLSAIAGNLVMLLLLIPAWPWLMAALSPRMATATLLSIIALLASSIAITLLRKKILTIGMGQVPYVVGVHLTRSVATLLVLALLWQSILPQVPVQSWLLMAAGRQLVTRLPFVPNKDLAFSSIVLVAGTAGIATSAAVATTGACIFMGQAALGAVLALIELRHFLPLGQPGAR